MQGEVRPELGAGPRDDFGEVRDRRTGGQSILRLRSLYVSSDWMIPFNVVHNL